MIWLTISPVSSHYSPSYCLHFCQPTGLPFHTAFAYTAPSVCNGFLPLMQNLLLTLRPPLQTHPQKAALPDEMRPSCRRKACPPSCSISQGDTLKCFIHVKIIHEYSLDKPNTSREPYLKIQLHAFSYPCCVQGQEIIPSVPEAPFPVTAPAPKGKDHYFQF